MFASAPANPRSPLSGPAELLIADQSGCWWAGGLVDEVKMLRSSNHPRTIHEPSTRPPTHLWPVQWPAVRWAYRTALIVVNAISRLPFLSRARSSRWALLRACLWVLHARFGECACCRENISRPYCEPTESTLGVVPLFCLDVSDVQVYQHWWAVLAAHLLSGCVSGEDEMRGRLRGSWATTGVGSGQWAEGSWRSMLSLDAGGDRL
ncbi:hypothetical protein B0J14DRAFT_356766 [Halenospora varia]|nr:hypothetical protein B0J14DRAFT_356766 [Halenospora varia]